MNHVLYDQVDKDYILFDCFAYKYSTMIFFVSHSTCAIILNDQIYHSQQEKSRTVLKTVDNFPRSCLCSIWIAKQLKSRVRVVLALDAFAFALCINGPLVFRSFYSFRCIYKIMVYFSDTRVSTWNYQQYNRNVKRQICMHLMYFLFNHYFTNTKLILPN